MGTIQQAQARNRDQLVKSSMLDALVNNEGIPGIMSRIQGATSKKQGILSRMFDPTGISTSTTQIEQSLLQTMLGEKIKQAFEDPLDRREQKSRIRANRALAKQRTQPQGTAERVAGLARSLASTSGTIKEIDPKTGKVIGEVQKSPEATKWLQDQLRQVVTEAQVEARGGNQPADVGVGVGLRPSRDQIASMQPVGKDVTAIQNKVAAAQEFQQIYPTLPDDIKAKVDAIVEAGEASVEDVVEAIKNELQNRPQKTRPR